MHQISAREREQAKRICYALLYGMGAASLSEEMGVSLEQGPYQPLLSSSASFLCILSRKPPARKGITTTATSQARLGPA